LTSQTIVPKEFIHAFHQQMQFQSNPQFDKWCDLYEELDARWLRDIKPRSISLMNLTYKILRTLNKPKHEDLFWATIAEIIRPHGAPTPNVISLLKSQGKQWIDGQLSPVNPVMLNPLEQMDALETLHRNMGLSEDYMRQIKEAYDDYTINGNPNGTLGKYRTALEKLLIEFAEYAQIKHPTGPSTSLDTTRPYSVRNFLKVIGFLHESEFEMIKGFYGWVSDTGSHEFAWETSEASVEFVMVMLPAWIRMFSERYDDFRKKYQ
jgi:hypothetical protein